MLRITRFVLPVVVVGVALGQLALLYATGVDSFADDTYISLTYARNLVEGRGLVFNPGERVEGFTHPLWVLLEALILLLRLPERAALETLGVAAWFLTIASVFLASREAGLSRMSRWLAPLVVASCTSLGFWSLSGMETMAHAALTAEGIRRFLAADRSGRRVPLGAAVTFGIATWLRPESLVVFGVCAALFLLRAREREHWSVKRALFAGMRGAAPYVLVVLPWQVFRVLYYGAWLPNTYYAKVDADRWLSLERGMDYLLDSGMRGPLLCLLFGIALTRAMRRFEVSLPSAVAAVHLAYVVWVGGDYMGQYRFIAPLIAPLALALAVGLAERASEVKGRREGMRSWSGTWRALLGVVTVSAAFLPYVVPPTVTSFKNATERYVPAALWLREHAAPNTLVAAGAVGAIAYFGGTRVLDEYGLTDHYIARTIDPSVDVRRTQSLAGHSRGNAAYVLSQRPELILLANVWVYRKPLTPERMLEHLELLSITDERLFADAAFLATYDILNFPLSNGRWFGLAVRKDSVLHPDHPHFRGALPYERTAVSQKM